MATTFTTPIFCSFRGSPQNYQHLLMPSLNSSSSSQPLRLYLSPARIMPSCPGSGAASYADFRAAAVYKVKFGKRSDLHAVKNVRSAMATKAVSAVLLLCTCCLLITTTTLAICDGTAAGGDVKFAYSGSMGPENWGRLSPNFRSCATGTEQSPIDIRTDQAVYAPEMEPLRSDYTASNATLVNNIHNIALELQYEDGAGTVQIDGKKYRLQQMHWHSPSEHTINGRRFPVELHMVHSSEDGSIAVVSTLYRLGTRPDPFLMQIQDKLSELNVESSYKGEQGGAPVPAGVVSLSSLPRHGRVYYRYAGSLTTPPCTEPVVWTILGQVREMTAEQAAALMAPLEEGYRRNSRPTQPLNGRTVRVALPPLS